MRVGLPPLGETLASYRIEEVIGRGGMSVVCRAHDLKLERPVALKLLSADLAENPRFRDRFLRESRLAASLDHPNIIPIYDAGEADGRLYIAMKLVDGTDLKGLLRREGPLAAARAIQLLAPVALALDAAHAHGLVHRDVKPANVLVALEPHEQVYLADFGLTKKVTTVSGPTITGQLLGTVDYVSPEQIRGGRVDGRSDVYSLACVLFECLVGSPPFERDSDIAVLLAHLNDPPPRVTELRPELSAGLDAVVASGLSKDSEARPTTCTTLLVAAERASLGAKRSRAALLSGTLKRTVRRRGPLLVGALAAIGAAALAASATVATRGREAPPVALPNALLRLDAASGKLDAAIPTGRLPTDVTVDADNAAWVVSARDGTVAKLDLSSNEIVRTVSIRGTPRDIAAAGGAIWVTSSAAGEGLLTKLDLEGDVAAITPLGRIESFGIAATRDGVWIAGQGGGGRGGIVIRVAPGTGAIAARLPLASKPVAVTAGVRAIWVVAHLAGAGSSAPAEGTVYRVDRRTNAIASQGTVAFSGPPAATAAAAPGGIWISTGSDVLRLDPRTGRRVGVVRVEGRVVDLAVADGSVWALTGGTVARIDAEAMSVIGTMPVTSSDRMGALEATSLTLAGRRVLLTTAAAAQTVVIGETRAVSIKARPAVTRIRYGAGSIWSKSITDPLVSRIDPGTNRLVATIVVGTGHGDIAFGHGSVWVTSFDEDAVTRIDPKTNRVLARIPTGGLAPVGVTITSDAVWVANHHGDPTGSVTRIDPRSNRVVATIPLGASDFAGGPANLVTAFGDVWVDIPNQAVIVRIDAETNRVVARIDVETGCGQLAADDAVVWFAEGCSSGVLRIDPRTNRIAARIETGNAPAFPIAVGGGSVWVGTNDQRLLRIDPSTNAVVSRTEVRLSPNTDHPAFFIAHAEGSLWLADGDGGRVLRVQP